MTLPANILGVDENGDERNLNIIKKDGFIGVPAFTEPLLLRSQSSQGEDKNQL